MHPNSPTEGVPTLSTPATDPEDRLHFAEAQSKFLARTTDELLDQANRQAQALGESLRRLDRLAKQLAAAGQHRL